jgi:DNA-binding transcriptional ArsR family regulator
MYRRVLIAALVCSLWIAAIAVPPGLADTSGATPDNYESDGTFAMSDDGGGPDESAESDDGNETDASDANDSDDSQMSGDRKWRDSEGSDDSSENESDDRRWGNDSENRTDDGNESDAQGWSESEDSGETNQSDAGNESDYETGVDDSEETDESGETNESDDQEWGDSGEPDDTDDGANANESDDRNGSGNLTDAVTNGTAGSATGATASPLEDAREDPNVELSEVLNGTLVEEMPGESAGGAVDARSDDARVGLDVDHDSRVDFGYGDLVGENATVAGVMTLPLSSVLKGLYPDAKFLDPTSGLEPDVGGADASAEDADRPASGSAVSVESDDASTGAGESDGSGDDGPPFGGEVPDGAGEGAALFLVGYLGGHRLLASQPSLLAGLRETARWGLGDLGLPVVPPLFGYSRHDESDPLDNETRANIYDVVTESPGVYYAQLAEQTDVTEETVRYHSRILADEGLVERRKIRGRKRLYPVSMEGEDAELAAAMADSAASDVISAIEHREPATLSAVADAIGCAPSTVSYHLDRLEEDGLISRERDGSAVRIELRRPTRTALEGGIADD